MTDQSPNYPGGGRPPSGPQPGPQPGGPAQPYGQGGYPAGGPGGPGGPPPGYGPGPGAPGAGGPGAGGPGGPAGPGGYGAPSGPGGPGGQAYPPQGPGGPGAGGPGGPGGPGGWAGPDSFAGGPEPKGGRTKTPLIVGLAIVLVLVIGGGAFAATKYFGSSGSQPEEALPGNAVAYMRLDLNPSGQDKVNVYQFLQKFPEVKKNLGSQDEDPRKQFFDAIKKSDGSSCVAKLDYATDIEPWIGNRLGLAAVPSEGKQEPSPVVALEVTDEGKAKDGIAKLNSCDKGQDKPGVAFDNGYAVLAENQAAADNYVKSAQSSSLASNEQFKSDMAALGDTGVMSFWADGKQLASLTKSAAGQMGGLGQMGTQGRVVGAIRFDSRYVELAGLVRGVPKVKTGGAKTTLGELPGTTAAALSVGGAGEGLKNAWPTIQQSLNQAGMGGELSSMTRSLQQQLGINIPDDLVTLLGQETAVAVDSDGLAAVMSSGGQQMPKIGVRFTTDTAKAGPIVDKLLGAMGSQLPVQLGKASANGKLAVATSQAYADELTKSGTLGQNEGFKLAVPDAGNAQSALYVDLDKLEPLYLQSMQPDERANVQPLQAFGVSGGYNGDDVSFTARLVVN